MIQLQALRHRYSVHGLTVELSCQVPKLLDLAARMLGDFEIHAGAARASVIRGIVRPYDQQEVLRHLSPTAKRITADQDFAEIYEEGERFWLIDDHWGLCEINLLKGQWRSWVIGTAQAEAHQVIEQAILWPMSQLAAPRGLGLIRSAAVTRDGWGALLLAVGDIEPELSVLVRSGYRVIGQSWTALREIDGRVVMHPMPGQLNRAGRAIDLTREFYGCAHGRAECDTVLMISPLRRAMVNLDPIPHEVALAELKRNWPGPQVHSPRRQMQLQARMAGQCELFAAHLSRNPGDVLALMESARTYRPHSVSVSVLLKHMGRRIAA